VVVTGQRMAGAPLFRLALGAHVQFVRNGMLFTVLAALLLALPHGVSRGSIRVMLLSAWFMWAMALSEVANAWWGTRQTLPIMAEQAGASGGARWQELIVTATYMVWT
jgi:(hydroxyamino)benzene mutase